MNNKLSTKQFINTVLKELCKDLAINCNDSWIMVDVCTCVKYNADCPFDNKIRCKDVTINDWLKAIKQLN